jgi:hypothetical protein
LLPAFAAVAIAMSSTEAAAQAAPRRLIDRGVGILLRMNFDFGGDTVDYGAFTNGDEWKIKAGQLFTFAGGVIVHPDAPWAVEATAGYKFDQVNGSNGTIKFTRIPVDVVVSWAPGGHRLGAGATVHVSPTYRCDVSGLCDITADWDTAFGAIVQYAYGLKVGDNGAFDVGARYTYIQYAGTGLPDRDGSAFGFFFGGWF